MTAGGSIVMGISRSPLPVKLFVGMLASDKARFDAAGTALSSEYGPISMHSDTFAWNRTDYYRDELGTGILRKFVFFEKLFDPAILPAVKHFTNTLEYSCSTHHDSLARRTINLDPGYVTEAKVVLASTKDFAHRMYIGNGIYAEVTLRYSAHKRSFEAVDHTYPDFREATHLQLFNLCRTGLRKAMQEKGRK